ncbi:MAG: toprim domain-containing protein, partial [Chloroflexota bacterium]
MKTAVGDSATVKSGAPRTAGSRGAGTGTTLVVVESPTKARTISAILGPRYQVMASKGHVADLPEKGLGYDETTFEPVYVVPPRKAKDLAALKDAAKYA